MLFFFSFFGFFRYTEKYTDHITKNPVYVRFLTGGTYDFYSYNQK